MCFEINEAIKKGLSRKYVEKLFNKYNLLIEKKIQRKKNYNKWLYGATRNIVVDYWI